jgi:chemotaxis protein histidine kinase CheA
VTFNHAHWQQIQATFGVELEERVQALNELFLQLEREAPQAEARREVYDALFREAHNLKGAARVVGLDALEQLAHALESSLDGMRQTATAPDQRWFDRMYRATDLLTSVYHALVQGETPPAALDDLMAALQASPSAAPALDEPARRDETPAPSPVP